MPLAPGLEIGAFAMIGMGSVVTGNIPAFALAFGVPAKVSGWVCRCGEPLVRGELSRSEEKKLQCAGCGLEYRLCGGSLAEELNEKND